MKEEMRYNIYLGQIVKAPENSEAPKQKSQQPGSEPGTNQNKKGIPIITGEKVKNNDKERAYEKNRE